MTAGGIADWLKRVMDGVFQGCKSINDCGVAIALALLRRVLPQSGKAFMETRRVSEWGELRESLEDWMSGREKGNFFRPLGGGPSENTRGYRVRESNFGRENVRGGNDREKVGSTSGYLRVLKHSLSGKHLPNRPRLLGPVKLTSAFPPNYIIYAGQQALLGESTYQE